MATDEATLADPALLQFVERLIDKGMFPALVMMGLFALVWRFGWPKFGVSQSNPPPQPNAVVDALTQIRADVTDMRDAHDERLERIEADLRILLDRGQRK